MTRGWSRYVSRGLFYIMLTIIFVYIVFPFFWAFRSSVTPNSELFLTPVHWWPDNPTLEHYQEVFSNSDFLIAFATRQLWRRRPRCWR